MDFGKGYYKAYLNNNHTWWGNFFFSNKRDCRKIHMTSKEGWKYINDNYGVGYELVAIFPNWEE